MASTFQEISWTCPFLKELLEKSHFSYKLSRPTSCSLLIKSLFRVEYLGVKKKKRAGHDSTLWSGLLFHPSLKDSFHWGYMQNILCYFITSRSENAKSTFSSEQGDLWAQTLFGTWFITASLPDIGVVTQPLVCKTWTCCFLLQVLFHCKSCFICLTMISWGLLQQ